MKNKICFVVQRYGLEVNGGAELQCRQMAEKMVARYAEIHVLTTKAVDYMTWKNVYTKEYEMINGVHVHRFDVAHPRVQKVFDEINGRFLHGHLKAEDENEWMQKQGPVVPDLIQYLSMHKYEYDVFIFVTYLYYTTAIALPVVSEKAILIPEAHDEPFLRMKIFDDVFLKPQGILFNTEEERKLIHGKYHNEYIPNSVGGVGVDLPEDISGGRFRKKYHLDRYLVYVGRIDVSKNCDVLFQYFIEYKKRNADGLKLVLIGKSMMTIPVHPDIMSVGFVSDEDKFDGIAGAEALIVPSEFESLSMVVLEAMSVRTSVMVCGKCTVLRGHCIKSNGAFYYNNFFEFEGQINFLLKHSKERDAMLENAYRYVQENYRWDIILDRLDALIEKVP